MVQTVVKSDKRIWNKSQIYKIYRNRVQKYYKNFKQKIQMLQKNPLQTANNESLFKQQKFINRATGVCILRIFIMLLYTELFH